MDTSVAQDQIAAFVDRILRLKEEAKALNQDIREIYAEAKGQGFDKTVLGKLVNYVEKRADKPNELAEGEAIFDLYLTAYDSAKGRVGTLKVDVPRVHAREDVNWQAPRTASLGDQKDAFRSGNPISQDFQYENADVYFFAFPEIGRIKIGVSNNVEARLRDLSEEQGCEGLILHVMPGNRQAEMVEHERFNEWRVEGEWFRDCPEMRAIIATHTHEKSEPQVAPQPAKDDDAIAAVNARDGLADAIGVEPSSSIISPETANETVVDQTGPHDTVSAGHAGVSINRNTGGENETSDRSSVTFVRRRSDDENLPRDAAHEMEVRTRSAHVTEGPTSRNVSVTARAEGAAKASATINPRCQKAAQGDPCQFSHKIYSCSPCNNAWMASRQKVPA